MRELWIRCDVLTQSCGASQPSV